MVRARSHPRSRRRARRRKAARNPPRQARLGVWLGRLAGDHGADLWAIGLGTVGVLLALALYGSGAGIVGTEIGKGLGAVVGWARYLLPPTCVVAGVAVVVGRRRPDAWRAAMGTAGALLSICGLADLASGSPGLGASTHQLAAAGGYLGILSGRGLQLGVGTAGAAVLLAGLLAVALVVSTGITLRTLGARLALIAAAVASGTDRFRRLLRSLVVRPGAEGDSSSDDAQLSASTIGEASVPVDDHPRAFPAEDISARTPAADSMEAIEAEGNQPAADEDGIARSVKAPTIERPRRPAPGNWRLPPATLLSRSRAQRFDERQLEATGRALLAALAAHGVETRLLGFTVGPTVTRFELELASGVKVSRVTSLSRDIAYAMASPDVRILAPIPGMSAIGVEVPNRSRQLVCLGDILASEEAKRSTHPLEVALGKDISGRPVMVNLAEMPHVLISGATGAGKSSCINSLITSVLMRATPDDVRLILVDPKRVELGQYNGLPHLLTEVVVDPKRAANALAWAVKEMERRYDLLAEFGMRDITSYNEAVDRGELNPGHDDAAETRRRIAAVADRARARAAEHRASGRDCSDEDRAVDVVPAVPVPDEQAPTAERLPFVLVVVDELNDLMMVAARDVEESVVRIAQMARAVGIHLVLATQRPSVDVITGLIKANIPSRMAFSVSSLADSRVILDQPGAERLIGKGDMLLLTSSSNIPRRIQAPWVSESEVRRVVAHWRRQGGVTEPVVAVSDLDDRKSGRGASLDDDDDELLEAALELVVRSQLGSTSMLQRKLRVGFARAGRLMDLLERRGVVGPSEGSKARAVLMTPEELSEMSAKS